MAGQAHALTPPRRRRHLAVMTQPTDDAPLEFVRDGDAIRGYAAWPRGADPVPGLVVVPDVRGLSDHYRDVARRFAAEGFATFAIDLYSREGAPDLADMPSVFRWMAGLPDARILADLGAAVAMLAARPRVRSGVVGITGFCMGGQYALMAACTQPGIAACASWYGMLRYEEPTPHRPRSPLDLAPGLGCPYLGLFGRDDGLIPPADVEALRAILARGSQVWAIESYAGAGHAFFNDTRPDTYRPGVAARAWPRAVGFLHEHLGDPPQA